MRLAPTLQGADHAFLMNCHSDVQQTLRAAQLLRRHWSKRSRLFLYIDGNVHGPDDLAALSHLCDHVHLGAYEPNKCQSVLNAINYLMHYAGEKRVEVASFLHADMIPLDRTAFYHFLGRFRDSAKMLTVTPMWPDRDQIDFCNLHFRVPQALKGKLFPAVRIPLAPELDYNENQLTASFDRTCPGWLHDAYAMWAIVMPVSWKFSITSPRDEGLPKLLQTLDGTVSWKSIRSKPQAEVCYVNKVGHSLHGQFVFHNYVPESTVTHTDDDWFWDNYESLARLD